MVEDRVIVMREGVDMVRALSAAQLKWEKNMKLK
jgi:hypothetical protein